MSVNVTLNGSVYIIPETNEVGWGGNTTSYLVAIPAGVLQKTGGSFSLSAETDFGASFGLKSLYYKSRSSNIAATGILRLNNNSDSINWRNFANNADLALQVDTSNRLTYNGQPILTGVSPTDYVSSITGTANQVIASSSTGAVTLSLPQSIHTSANVQFGTLGLGSAIVASSILALTSTALGFLPPRMTTAQRDAISSPATGLFIYNTSTNANNYYNGSSWVAIAAGGTISSGLQFQLGYYAGTGTTISGLPLITASRALASDSNGLPIASTTTAAELAFVSGTTTNIQTQLTNIWTSVKNYGAIGNGIADDSVAIQNALNTGLNVYFPAGTYLINTGLTSSTEGQLIWGAGQRLSIIKAGGAINMLTVSQRYINIAHLRFDGDNVGLKGIYSTIPKTYVYNCSITKTVTTAIDLESFTQFITLSEIFENLGHGITFSIGGSNNDMHIIGNVISGNGKHGIFITSGSPSYSDGIFIAHNSMENNCTTGNGVTNYAHISVGSGTRAVFMQHNYHESDISQTGFASQLFYDIGAGCEAIQINNTYMLSAVANKFDYYIHLAASSYLVTIENCSIKGFNIAAINDALGASGRLYKLGNITGVASPDPLLFFNDKLILSDAGQLQHHDGTVAAPGITFISDLNTGIRRIGVDQISLVAGGVDIIQAGLFGGVDVALFRDGSVSNPSISLINDQNTGLYFFGTDILGFTAGGSLVMKVGVFGGVAQVQFTDGTAAAPAKAYSNDASDGEYRIGSHNYGWSTNGVLRVDLDVTRWRSNLPILIAPTAAGDAYHTDTINGGSSWSHGADDSDSDAFVISQNTSLGTNNVLKSTTAGEITQPLQPAFLASAPVNTTNVTGDGTTFTIEYDTEIFDQNADYDPATYIFTAPITGRYTFSASCLLQNIDSSHTGTTTFVLVTSNRNYVLGYYGSTFAQSGGGFLFVTGAVSEVDMDAGDTAKVTVRVAGGTKTVELYDDADFNKFSGTLIN